MVQSELVERFDTTVAALMTEAEARECIVKINGHMNSARALLLDLYERRGWKSLGYQSWRECVVSEFEQTQRTLYKQLEAAEIERRIAPMGQIGAIPERQLRPLAALTPMEQPIAWQEVQERSQGRPTARIVEQVVEEMRPRNGHTSALAADHDSDEMMDLFDSAERAELSIYPPGSEDEIQQLIDERRAARSLEVQEMRPRTVTPQDVASVIKDGARQVIDHAKQQWVSNAYGTDEGARLENLARWREIEDKVSEVAQPAKLAPLMSSASPEWYTPTDIIDRVKRVLGTIDLDPASNQEAQASVDATYWCGLDHPDEDRRDGLAREWPGKVYLNPPYGDVIGNWVARLIHQVDMDITTEAIALLPGRIDTAWFRPLWRCTFCAVHGRLKFSGADNSAPFPSIVVYFGDNDEAFYQAFHDIGSIHLPIGINQWLKWANQKETPQ